MLSGVSAASRSSTSTVTMLPSSLVVVVVLATGAPPPSAGPASSSTLARASVSLSLLFAMKKRMTVSTAVTDVFCATFL